MKVKMAVMIALMVNSLSKCVAQTGDRAAVNSIKRTTTRKMQPSDTRHYMMPKPNSSWRWFTRYGTVLTTSLLTLTASAIARSAPVAPFDEPPCFMRTQDGRVVNLQSLCSQSPIVPSQTTPTTNQQPAASPRTATPQAVPNQLSRPANVRPSSGSHSQGNPDSDDGRY